MVNVAEPANARRQDRFLYGHDRASNRLWRENNGPGAVKKDELYHYDSLDRLTAFERGNLNRPDNTVIPAGDG